MLERLVGPLLQTFLTIVVIITLTFFLLRVLPGGPFDTERQLPPQIKANMEARFHLNEPVLNQYVNYMTGIFKGDFGPSYKFVTRSVNDIVGPATWVSFQIGAMAMILGVLAGAFMGTWAATSRWHSIDQSLSLLGLTAMSIPSFIAGAMLVYVFSYCLNWLPAARLVDFQSAILPVFTLSLTPFAYTFMLMRTAIQDVRRMPFIHIKQCFGLPQSYIVIKHILKNALVPVLSILGPMAAAIVTGSFAVETIFAIPGIGKYFILGVSNRDYTLVIAITIIYSLFLCLFNTLTDWVREWIDPRLSQSNQA